MISFKVKQFFLTSPARSAETDRYPVGPRLEHFDARSTGRDPADGNERGARSAAHDPHEFDAERPALRFRRRGKDGPTAT